MAMINISINRASRPCSMILDLDPSLPNEQTILNYIATGQYYEPDVGEVFARILREGDTAIDVGANAGFFTMLGAALVGPAGHMLSFEPDPANCARLRNNVALNGFHHVTLVEQPAMDSPRPVDFFINSDDSGGNALWDPGQFPGNARSRATPTTMSLTGTTIDAEVERLGLPAIKLLKIDTEGADHLVLRGAAGLLAHHRVPFVICELHHFGLAKMGSSQAALREFMAGFGYDPFMLYYNGRLPHLVPRETVIQTRVFCNILFSTAHDVSTYWPEYAHDPGAA
jgi:FkbM family methyltransferase